MGEGDQSIQWDGRDQNGNLVASGHYFYRMKTSRGTVTKRMIVIK
jgi:flagellar hook assembly protein FlgD